MPNPFRDDIDVMETGDTTPACNHFGGQTPARTYPTTPFNPCTVSQVRQERRGSTTAHFRRVSTSILAAGGRDDGAVADQLGAAASAPRGGRDASAAPPMSTSQMRKFDCDVLADDADMLTIDVKLRKEDYGVTGSSDY